MEKWKSGDRAFCIKDGKWTNSLNEEHPNGPKYKTLYYVTEVGVSENDSDLHLLKFIGYDECFDSIHFKKVVPHSEKVD